MPTRSYLQSCGVDNHSTRGMVTLLDCVDDDHIFHARKPKGEGACHAGRPCSND
jgi:hypothetical protein